jgi:deoxyadenosine/deoxycytidine kinase
MSTDTQLNSFQIAIEGNIGAGKSTFLKLIGNLLPVNAALIPEPHQQWQRVGEDNLLERFYADPSRWAYTFQSYVIMTRLRVQRLYRGHALRIAERSIYSDYYCFARNCYEAGLLSPLEWKIYEDWFMQEVTTQADPVHGFIYLRTSPTLCYERIAKRKRYEEAEVPLAYLQSIHDKHEDLLIHRIQPMPSMIVDKPVLVIECDEEFEQDLKVQERYAGLVLDFLRDYGAMPKDHDITNIKSKNVSALF